MIHALKALVWTRWSRWSLVFMKACLGLGGALSNGSRTNLVPLLPMHMMPVSLKGSLSFPCWNSKPSGRWCGLVFAKKLPKLMWMPFWNVPLFLSISSSSSTTGRMASMTIKFLANAFLMLTISLMKARSGMASSKTITKACPNTLKWKFRRNRRGYLSSSRSFRSNGSRIGEFVSTCVVFFMLIVLSQVVWKEQPPWKVSGWPSNVSVRSLWKGKPWRQWGHGAFSWKLAELSLTLILMMMLSLKCRPWKKLLKRQRTRWASATSSTSAGWSECIRCEIWFPFVSCTLHILTQLIGLLCLCICRQIRVWCVHSPYVHFIIHGKGETKRALSTFWVHFHSDSSCIFNALLVSSVVHAQLAFPFCFRSVCLHIRFSHALNVLFFLRQRLVLHCSTLTSNLLRCLVEHFAVLV